MEDKFEKLSDPLNKEEGNLNEKMVEKEESSDKGGFLNILLLTTVFVLIGLFLYFFFTDRLILGIENPFLKEEVKTCTYNGVEYSEGEGFPSDDGCNSCSCVGGEVACTLMACNDDITPNIIIQSCFYYGKEYNEGDGFPSEDGCNTCSCTDSEVVCTLMECLPD